MRPLAALIGIVMGSAVAMLAGLLMVLLVFLLLPEFRDRLSGEYVPLAQAIAWAALLTLTSSAAFVGELKERRWRRGAQLGMVAAVLMAGWNYWPS